MKILHFEILFLFENSLRFYRARTQEFQAWKYQSDTKSQLCQNRLDMVTKQNNTKKRGIQRFWCTVFKIFRLKKSKKSKKLDILPQEYAVPFSKKKCFSAIHLIFEWIYSKDILNIQTKQCWELAERFELSQSINNFLKQHFTQACIYYSVIQSKTFLSLLGLKMLVMFHSKLAKHCIFPPQKNASHFSYKFDAT